MLEQAGAQEVRRLFEEVLARQHQSGLLVQVRLLKPARGESTCERSEGLAPPPPLLNVTAKAPLSGAAFSWNVGFSEVWQELAPRACGVRKRACLAPFSTSRCIVQSRTAFTSGVENVSPLPASTRALYTQYQEARRRYVRGGRRHRSLCFGVSGAAVIAAL